MGSPTMGVIADRCLQVQVQVADINHARIDAWDDAYFSKLTAFELGLDRVVARAYERKLFCCSAVAAEIDAADLVFISVNTSTKTKGLGAGQASHLRWVEACACELGQASPSHTIVMKKITFPLRTVAAFTTILKQPVRERISARFRSSSILRFWRKERPSAIWSPLTG